jgi:PAS domain S-box-containing protein
VDSVSEGIWQIDAEARTTYVSQRFAQMLGHSPAELMGRSALELLVDIDTVGRERARELLGLGRARLSTRRDFRIRRRDGSVLRARGLSAPIHDAQGHCAGAVITITERPEDRDDVDAALRESGERYRALVEQAGEGIWLTDVEGRILEVNESACKVLGYRRDELIEGRLLDLIHPDDAAQRPENFTSLEAGQTIVAQRRFRRKDGTYVLLEGTARMINGRHCLTITRDITEQKLAEEALRRADRRKDEFLAMLAHELRNPLSPILNSLAILRARLPAGPDLERHREIIERQARHLARMLDDLLDVSRITRDKIELRKEPMELSSLIEEATQGSASAVDGARHELTVTIPKEPLWLKVDPTRMVQVLCNLLNNAAKYTPPGGRIWLTAEREGATVAIQVRDTGRGITAELLPHVFELFVQEERTLDRSQGGLGIGLTMVRRLVELHGGSVEAWSAGAHQGSQLTVRLPLMQQDGDAAARGTNEEGVTGNTPVSTPRRKDGLGRIAKERAERSSSAPVRVLLVEDNVDAVETLSELLRMWGHEVEAVLRGKEAIEVCPTFRPDVILLDIGLPEMDGYEVARRLRASGGAEGAVIVALTGYGQPQDRARSREAGFDQHLTKPIDPDTLRAMLQQLAVPG